MTERSNEPLKGRCAVFPRGYLPMDCPVCARRRLEYGVNDDGGVIYVECEKCGANSDDETLERSSMRARRTRHGFATDTPDAQ